MVTARLPWRKKVTRIHVIASAKTMGQPYLIFKLVDGSLSELFSTCSAVYLEENITVNSRLYKM